MIVGLIVVLIVVLLLLGILWSAESQSRSLKRIRQEEQSAEFARRRREAGLPPYDRRGILVKLWHRMMKSRAKR
jgi:hypothetical protein